MPSTNRSSLWWINANPNSRAKTKLICFPYAGGSAAPFHSWHLHLNEDIEVYGIQLPGRARRIAEAPYIRIPELVPELGKALRPLLDTPFAFFGHSMGAILAFELSRWIRKECQVQPQHMLISAHRAPQIQIARAPLHRMNDADFLASIISLNGVSTGVQENRELLDLMIPTLRADCEMDETYRFIEDEPLNCPITVFRGADDESVEGTSEDWRIHTVGQFTQYSVAGGHFFIHSHEKMLLNLVRESLYRTSLQ